MFKVNLQLYKLLYSRKYWQELNLADFNLAVVKWDHQTAKFSGYTVYYVWLINTY